MFSVFCTVLLVIITNILFLHFIRRLKFRSLNNIPGPKSYPIVGSLLEFQFDLVDTFKSLLRLSEKYTKAPFFKLWLGPWNVYLLSTDPQFIEFILSSTKHIKKSEDLNIIKPFMKNGLVTAHGSYWQKHRKLINPAFYIKVFESYIRIFNAKSNILIGILAKYVDAGDFDVRPYIAKCTLDVITESAMGTSIDAQTTTDNTLAINLKKGMNICISRCFSAWKRFDFLFQFSSEFKKFQELVEFGETFTKNLIDKRRQLLLNNNNNNNNEDEKISGDDVGRKKIQVFLDILLQGTIDGKPLTDEEILEEVNTFLVAGADTTAVLLMFTMYELAKNPDIQNKLFLEVKDVFNGDKSYQPTLEDLNAMKYMELVLKETLRLHSSIPMITRQLEVDVNYNGIIIPKDTIIVPFIYAMHRREDLFPNASKYDPERFVTQSDTILPFSYVPFSAGPRNCIGQKYGLYEAAVIISKVLMNFEILPAVSKRNLVVAGAFTLIAPKGVHIQLKRRQIETP